MSVFLYQGGFRIVQKSGVGQAIVHQKQALEAAHIPVTTQFSADTQVIHINTVFPDSLLKALWAKRHGIKIVYYAHSTMEDFRNSFACSNVLAPFFRRWLLLCYGQGDVILTPTDYSKQLLLSYGIHKPIYSISNGVAADYFRFQKQRRTAFRQAYHLAPEAPVVISVGHMIERKGIFDYIDLARRMPDVTFFWFGYTKPWLLPKNVRNAIHSAPANLIFAGYVNQDQLLDAYCGADVFAFLSKDHESVYKANDLSSFESTIRQMLNGTLPSLTGKGRAVALERSFPKIGQQLVSIYAAEGIVNETITQSHYSLKRAARAQS